MADFQFPSDGSILIVDDKIEEALPLIQLLSKKGFATTYFDGKDSTLPNPPVQKVRFAFIDIQLFGPSDAHSYAQNILRVLETTIPENNGPYILIIWSTTEKFNSDEVERQVTSSTFLKRPVKVVRLQKSIYFETITDSTGKDELKDEIENSLKARFSKDDLDVIKRTIDQNFPDKAVKKVKKNAIELIYKELEANLSSIDTFNLFTVWEKVIHNASGQIVNSYSSLHETNEYWQDNLKYSIYRMAHAQLGKTVDTVNEHEFIKNALKTLNQTFLDIVENQISQAIKLPGLIKIERNKISFAKKISNNEYKIKWTARSGRYQIYINNILIPVGDRGTDKITELFKKGRNATEKTHINVIVNDYISIKPEINSRLLIDFNTYKVVQPSNVYQKHVPHWNRRKTILSNYFKKKSGMLDDKGNFIPTNKELQEILFIELEVTPICDYVQEKWIKSRLLPGLLVPEKYCDLLQNSESFYSQIPLLKYNDCCYKPVFDFRLLKSVDIEKDQAKIKIPLFRLRSELFADILSRLSSHISRVGIAYIE